MKTQTEMKHWESKMKNSHKQKKTTKSKTSQQKSQYTYWTGTRVSWQCWAGSRSVDRNQNNIMFFREKDVWEELRKISCWWHQWNVAMTTELLSTSLLQDNYIRHTLNVQLTVLTTSSQHLNPLIRFVSVIYKWNQKEKEKRNWLYLDITISADMLLFVDTTLVLFFSMSVTIRDVKFFQRILMTDNYLLLTADTDNITDNLTF